MEMNSFIFNLHFILVKVTVDRGSSLWAWWKETWMGRQWTAEQVIEMFNSISVVLYAYTYAAIQNLC